MVHKNLFFFSLLFWILSSIPFFEIASFLVNWLCFLLNVTGKIKKSYFSRPLRRATLKSGLQRLSVTKVIFGVEYRCMPSCCSHCLTWTSVVGMEVVPRLERSSKCRWNNNWLTKTKVLKGKHASVPLCPAQIVGLYKGFLVDQPFTAQLSSKAHPACCTICTRVLSRR